MTEKVKGPASCFPSIGKTCGKPVGHRLGLAAAQAGRLGHMQAVGRLKAEHGPGHGHANAIVAHVGAQK